MPFYPTIPEIAATAEITNTFMGYNHNLKINSGEFFEMENMTGDYYPLLSPRGKRGIYASPTAANGLIAKDALCYVDGADFVINGLHVQMQLSTAAADNPKQLVSMGTYVIIMPDKKYINTKDLTDFGNIEASFTTAQDEDVSFTLTRIDGADYSNPIVSPTAPVNPSNMDYWIDTSSTPHQLKQWSEVSGMWVSVTTTYVKISSPGIGSEFSQYDGVRISGVTVSSITDLNGSFTIWAKTDEYIVIDGLIEVVSEQQTPVTVERLMPNMDFVIENENRLWGCRYGVAENGEVVNEIYASKLGDFKNWNSFMGISTDSYAVSCGTDGVFTGAISHLGYPLFFKENYLHKVYGSYPAQYQVKTTPCRGVQAGSGRSLAIVNEILYYKGINGVCAYDGSLPNEISTAFGGVKYFDAVGGSNNNKYYISMRDEANAYHLFVFDTKHGFWHREDNTNAKAFCSCDGELYYIDNADGKIRTELGSGTRESGNVHWMVQTGVLGLSAFGKKYISRVIMRLSLTIGAKVSLQIRYNSVGDWEHVFTMTGKTLQSFSIPIFVRRCDHFQLRIIGDGEAKIYSLVKNIEAGSDL